MLPRRVVTGWARCGHPDRLPANYHKLHGVRQFHGCYSVGEGQVVSVYTTPRRDDEALTVRIDAELGTPCLILICASE